MFSTFEVVETIKMIPCDAWKMSARHFVFKRRFNVGDFVADDYSVSTVL